MSKLPSTLLTGALALALSGIVIAADPRARNDQTEAQPNATQGKPGQQDAERVKQGPGGSAPTDQQSRKGGSHDPAQGKPTQSQANQSGTDEGKMGRNEDPTGDDLSAKDKEYSAALKKCDSMRSAKKLTCIDTAEKKHSQM